MIILIFLILNIIISTFTFIHLNNVTDFIENEFRNECTLAWLILSLIVSIIATILYFLQQYSVIKVLKLSYLLYLTILVTLISSYASWDFFTRIFTDFHGFVFWVVEIFCHELSRICTNCDVLGC